MKLATGSVASKVMRFGDESTEIIHGFMEEAPPDVFFLLFFFFFFGWLYMGHRNFGAMFPSTERRVQ